MSNSHWEAIAVLNGLMPMRVQMHKLHMMPVALFPAGLLRFGRQDLTPLRGPAANSLGTSHSFVRRSVLLMTRWIDQFSESLFFYVIFRELD